MKKKSEAKLWKVMFNYILSLTSKNRYNAKKVLLQFHDHDGLKWQLFIKKSNNMDESNVCLNVLLEEKKVIKIQHDVHYAISNFTTALFENLKSQQRSCKFYCLLDLKSTSSSSSQGWKLTSKHLTKKNALFFLATLV